VRADGVEGYELGLGMPNDQPRVPALRVGEVERAADRDRAGRGGDGAVVGERGRQCAKIAQLPAAAGERAERGLTDGTMQLGAKSIERPVLLSAVAVL